MRFACRTLIILLLPLLILWSDEGLAQKKSATTKRSGFVAADVVTDGALVYKNPDFDSEVLGQLAQGQKIRSSNRTYGSGAKFYFVKIGKVSGYVPDIDLKVQGVQSARPKTSKREKDPKKPQAKNESKSKKKDLPVYFSRFVGLGIGQIAYKEGIAGVDAKEGLLFYGLKVSGPDVVLDGPVVDFDVMLHYGAPSYYEKLSATKPSGFVLMTDVVFLAPLVNRYNQMAFFGIGPMAVISNFKVTNSDRPMDLTALNLGLVFSLGGAIRIENVAMRLEGRYYYEKQTYYGVQLALQSGF